MKKLPHEEGYFRKALALSLSACAKEEHFPNDVRPSFRHQFDSDKIPTRKNQPDESALSSLLDKQICDSAIESRSLRKKMINSIHHSGQHKFSNIRRFQCEFN